MIRSVYGFEYFCLMCYTRFHTVHVCFEVLQCSQHYSGHVEPVS